MAIRHTIQSARPNNSDPGAIQPSHWNQDHTITGMLAALDVLAISPLTVLTFDASNQPVLLPQGSILTGVNAALTGVPTCPTASPGTNTTQIANTAFVQAAVTALIASAPGALNTLDELAAALNDDANFAATMTSALALKAPLANPTLTGTVTIPTPASSTNSQQAASTAFAYAISGGKGQCKLAKVSSNLVLTPFDGNLLTVNGVHCTVPDAGVSLAPTSLSPSTNYYIYATQSGGAINALEASITAPVADTGAANKGVMIKTGDPTRSLVGFARCITGPAWAYSPTQRLVRSWFNEKGVDCFASLSANRTNATTSFAELEVATRCEFLSWTGERAKFDAGGSVANATGAGGHQFSVSYDGVTTQPNGSVSNGAANDISQCHARGLVEPVEGYHYFTMIGAAQASGTASFYGDNNGRKCSLMVEVTR